MGKIRVILYGIGAIGSLIAKFLLEKKGIEIVGAVDIAKNKVGKDLGKVLGLERKLGIRVSNDVDSVLSKVKADVAVHATSPFIKDTFPQIVSIVKHGVNVVSTCEELAYPHVTEPKLAKKLDALAKQNNATVLGTGINPGFLMDTLVITLTAVCQKIEKIEVVRVMDAATRRLPFQKKIGAGLTVEEFQRKIENKQITGHVGLEQSIAMIADALAWKLDKITAEHPEPVVAKKPLESASIKVRAGEVAGLRQRAKGILKNKEAIVLDFQAYIGAEEEYDAVTIEGVPSVKQMIQPCVHGDIGTVAMVVNAIPKVINAPAGLLTIKDLPVPSAALEDMRKYLKT
ncbi:MAG: NADP-binding protein [Candidatus Bathyarchaeota archaeon]|nr:NADP-binding protein [Candidatus Bathyarchaeota archaeon]MDH5753619.1 NADP-binding protein [Candidatus Bathyarchaeota archaeon]